MKVLKEVRDEKDGNNKNKRYLCWECDKCGGHGFFAVDDDVEEIPEDRRKCCENEKQSE